VFETSRCGVLRVAVETNVTDSHTWIDRTRRVAPEEARMLAVARDRIEELEMEVAELVEKIGQLETALTSQAIVEQAKGALSDRLAVGVDEAFALLRSAARSHHTDVHDVATRVISEQTTPAPIVVAIARTQRARAAWMREVAQAHAARVTELHAAINEQMTRLRVEREVRRPRG
jgi:hypothetical protein